MILDSEPLREIELMTLASLTPVFTDFRACRVGSLEKWGDRSCMAAAKLCKIEQIDEVYIIDA